MATFDPNRIGPGTFELVRDSTTGNYTIKEVGFTKISPLNLPDLDTTAATTTAAQTQTATDVTGDTVSQQTKMAFNMPDRGGDNQPDTTGNMLQEAKKTSSMLDDTFATSRRLITDTPNYNSGIDIQSPEIKDPTATVFGRPREGTIDQAAIDRQRQSDLGLEQPTVRTNIKGLSARGTIDRRQGTTQETTDDSRFLPSNIATRSDQGEMVAPGIETTKPLDTTTVSDQDLEADEGTKARADIKPKESALKTLSTSLNTAFKNIKTPMMMVVNAIGRSRGESAGAVAHNKKYFTDRGDGRIGGNPATDLYAGMNRVSAFGNLAKAGDKRIARREKTIATKKVSQKFIDDTNKMKEQANDYKQSLKEAPVTGTTKPGESGGSQATGGKIVCTMMNESYGFGSFRNKIWMKFHGNIAPEYQKGYHKLFLPLVNYAKQKGITNKIIKNILEHIAVHSTIDMRQTLRGKKHTLGRLYRKVILPLCYWVGKV
jgi:hypothetical protein